MSDLVSSYFEKSVSRNVLSTDAKPPEFTADLAKKLLDRIRKIKIHAHAYALLTNLTHYKWKIEDMLYFAYHNELNGLNIHLADGESGSLGNIGDDERKKFAELAKKLDLEIVLEVSSTDKATVDKLFHIANVMDVHNLRVYGRYEGPLDVVMDKITDDLHYITSLAEKHDCYVDFEQHEELKSQEIATILKKVNSKRIHALFDFGNMINAYEAPMEAFFNLAPFIRAVHMKGVKVVDYGGSTGHYGVLQGSDQDEMPSERFIYELLMLGDDKPQVKTYCLEQENHYVAPPFRSKDEGENPFIKFRNMSETPVPEGMTLEKMLNSEPVWAYNQLKYFRKVLTKFEVLCELKMMEGNHGKFQ
ncbi:sugar phosphate isomerase/epimerase family protein [Microbacteriaceae bacterium 4G12]